MDTKRFFEYIDRCKICAFGTYFVTAILLLFVFLKLHPTGFFRDLFRLFFFLAPVYVLYKGGKEYKRYLIFFIIITATAISGVFDPPVNPIVFVISEAARLVFIAVYIYILYISRSLVFNSLTTIKKTRDYIDGVIYILSVIFAFFFTLASFGSLYNAHGNFIADTYYFNFHHDGIKGKRAFGLGLVVDNYTAGIGGNSRLDIIVVCNYKSKPLAISEDDFSLSMYDVSGREYYPSNVQVSHGGASSGYLSPGMCGHVQASFVTSLDTSQDYLVFKISGHKYYLPTASD
ncbi:hypothetical protein [Candidatus Igneacidithiobacillus taiwanensis]|uniref:hypothetical protein n=1 Tax=Candidatus Igneacidithiobacillus taiwanensis TaxID=1945924 RepID=UPI00289EE004|nr:hypothetical protein [Candidatus Igneacidithiobacillus taiwanensis]